MTNWRSLFKKQVALPSEHGTWVFLLSPLLIGIIIGDSWRISAALWLVIGAMAAFLLRQPITVLVKVYSRRRSRRDLPSAWFWIGVYGLVGVAALFALLVDGFGFLLWLALPAVPVFLWHLYLVSRRSERHKMDVEIVGSGTLALAAPAGYWLGQGYADSYGWVLWLLLWFQSAASIVFIYLRLEQRGLDEIPPMKKRLQMGWRALLYSTFNLFAVAILGLVDVLPVWLFLAYAVQWIETILGTFLPVTKKVKPTVLGFRQLGVSIVFTIVFIITWLMG